MTSLNPVGGSGHYSSEDSSSSENDNRKRKASEAENPHKKIKVEFEENPEKAMRLFHEAIQNVQFEYFDKAVDCLRTAKRYSKLEGLDMWLCTCLSQLGRFLEVKQTALDALGQDPRGKEAFYEFLSTAHLNLREPKDAERTAREGLEFEETASLYLCLGQACHAQSKFDEQIEAAQRGIELDEGFVKLYACQANGWERLEKWEECEGVARKGCEIAASRGVKIEEIETLYTELAIALNMQEKYAEAIPFLLSALEVKESARTYKSLALAYNGSEEYQKAIEAADKGLETASEDTLKALLKNAKAESYNRLNEHQKAEGLAREALAPLKDFPDMQSAVCFQLATALRGQGKSAEAAEMAKKAREDKSSPSSDDNNGI